MKIGILAAGSNEGDLLVQFGSFAQMTETMLTGAGFDFQTWDVRLGAFPDSAAQCDGWIITGSPASVYQPLTWIAPLEQLIREVDGLKRPLVGICFGHQIIARALGGSVVKSDLGWGLGIDSYASVGSGESLLGCDSIPLHVIHQDQVAVLPERAERVAGSAFCPNGVLRYDDHIFTLQAHPEFSLEYMQALLASIAPEHISYRDAGNAMHSLRTQQAGAAAIIDQIVAVLRGAQSHSGSVEAGVQISPSAF